MLALSSLFSAATASAAPTATEAWVHKALACACYEGAELRIDAKRSLASADCGCPFAARVRKDVAKVVADMPLRHDFDRMKVALQLEEQFLGLSPEYERLLRYDAKRYRWFLENVRCTCSGCKATVYFSNCQLSCAPAVVYKRRARVWLALGFTTDQLIDFYLAEHNRTHAHREQITRDWLLPRKQKKRGWMVPAALIFGAIVVLGGFLRRIVARSAPTAAAPQPSAPQPPQPEQPAHEMSEADRNRLLDELDSLDD